jgi:CheY-like chemotaxis protein
MHKPLVVIADDDRDDRFLFKEALEDAGVAANIIEFADGEELIDFILSDCRGMSPRVIILDLKMPRQGGIDVLTFFKYSSGFSSPPVVIFTASRNAHDKTMSMSLGAVEYFDKPITFAGYRDVIDSLNKYL